MHVAHSTWVKFWAKGNKSKFIMFTNVHGCYFGEKVTVRFPSDNSRALESVSESKSLSYTGPQRNDSILTLKMTTKIRLQT